ncbi:hypothetical protein KIPE111705_39585 [Kibdelosporangium persicum]|uniref:WXG100 family type VII secretion target n=1 Tax=Kibdelosporangium persicum TaxID=2698649 RepID=A0ABX2FD56_9PSEU|nr:hypothetical protein [Kibdelosporangium persicum]NRN68743.1 hypothetical protein [Kibdelosporangium persicum]
MAYESFWGMDPEGALTNAHDLRELSANLSVITRGIQQLVDALYWQGEDADRFRDGWNDFAPTVIREADAASENSRELSRRAWMQDKASMPSVHR